MLYSDNKAKFEAWNKIKKDQLTARYGFLNGYSFEEAKTIYKGLYNWLIHKECLECNYFYNNEEPHGIYVC